MMLKVSGLSLHTGQPAHISGYLLTERGGTICVLTYTMATRDWYHYRRYSCASAEMAGVVCGCTLVLHFSIPF